MNPPHFTDTNLTYNVFHQESFGVLLALYFFLTGLSAGSFIISTLSYVFGMKKYKSLGRVGVVLAVILLLVAPLCLLLHSGRPLRAWHLFVYINATSPISWGSFLLTLYPTVCIVYAYFMFRGSRRWTRRIGIVGIPLAVAVHGYTGWILSFAKSRALWNTPLMPTLFLVSAMVSGLALMMIVSIVRDKYFTEVGKINREVLDGLSKFLVAMLLFDLFLVLSEVSILLVSHKDAQEAAWMLITGSFAVNFIVVENLLGKVIPLVVLATPRLRTPPALVVVSIIIIVGIFIMRYNVVVGGEYLNLI